MNFPIVQNRSGSGAIVNAKTYSDILEVVGNTSLEALEYATEVILKADKRAGHPPQNQQAVKNIVDHRNNMQKVRERLVSPWAIGRWEDVNIVQAYNLVLSDEAVKDLLNEFPQGQAKAIDMSFELDEKGRFLRGYFDEQQAPLSPEMFKRLDVIWNLWLVQNDMVVREGIVYATNQNGAKTDERIHENVLYQRITDPKKGLSACFRDKGFIVAAVPVPKEAPTQEQAPL